MPSLLLSYNVQDNRESRLNNFLRAIFQYKKGRLINN